MTETLFWIAFAFVAYTYLGYPALVWTLSRLRAEQDAQPPAEWPSVAVVMACHNERDKLAAKLDNLRRVDYPQERLVVVVASDGSTDGTAELLASRADVVSVSYAPRQGKPHALNRALERVEADIVVFTDVRQALAPDSVKRLVARLGDTRVGAVSGELVHRDPETNEAASIGLYWRYEKMIRKAESRLYSTVGVTGALYAIRRADYAPLPADTILDDLVQPMLQLRGGRRVLFEPRAVIYDELQKDAQGERKRKVRTLTGNFQAISRYRWMLSPIANPVFFQLVSHKLFRLGVPYALVVMLASSLASNAWPYLAIAVAQLLFYGLACAGYVSAPLRKVQLVGFAVVFLELNVAAVLALRNFMRGGLDARWEKT
jgi:biofilm PGA synthesis N-glycosyltransferase PgaC